MEGAQPNARASSSALSVTSHWKPGAEVSVGRRLLVDRTAEVEVLDDGGGTEIEHLPNHLLQPARIHLGRAGPLHRMLSPM